MRVGICDDDKDCQMEITRFIKEYDTTIPIEVTIYSTIQSLTQNKQSLDVLFLDIEVGEENSLDYFVQKIVPLGIPMIVLVSSHTCYVTQAYQVTISQFLLKPIQWDLFMYVFARCCDQYQKLHQWRDLWDSQGKLWQIPLSKISYITKEQRRIVYVHMSGMYYYGVTNSLTAVEEDLLKYGFYRIAKSVLVNFHHVIKLEQSKVIVQCGSKRKELSIGAKYSESVKQSYLRYLAEQKEN